MTTESDSELLELAARAHGGLERVGTFGWIHVDSRGQRGAWWSPLTDDGDALRLAVKLHLCLLFPMQGERFKQCGAGQVGGSLPACMEPHDPDPFAATRRAIVRAAAAIARATHKEQT